MRLRLSGRPSLIFLSIFLFAITCYLSLGYGSGPPLTLLSLSVQTLQGGTALSHHDSALLQGKAALATRESLLKLLPRGKDACYSLCQHRVCRENGSGRLYSENDYVTEQVSDNGERILKCGTNKRFRVPNYFTIGYSQSGSSYFYALLTSHPSVDKACTKEINFFDRKLFAKGNRLGKRSVANEANGTRRESTESGHNTDQELGHLDPYLECFGTPRGPNRVVGDNTIKTVYSDPGLPLWIRALNPEMKMVVLLRDPVDRIYSRYALKGGGLGCEEHIAPVLCKGHFSAYISHQIAYTRKHCPELVPFISSPRYQQRSIVSGSDENLTKSAGHFSSDNHESVDPLAVYRCGETAGNAKLDTDTLISSMYGPHIAHWLNFFPLNQFVFVQSEQLFQNPEPIMQNISAFLGIQEGTKHSFTSKAKATNHNSHKKRSSRPIPRNVESSIRSFFHNSNAQLSRITGLDLSQWS